jgi:hypothetical protein
MEIAEAVSADRTAAEVAARVSRPIMGELTRSWTLYRVCRDLRFKAIDIAEQGLHGASCHVKPRH